MRIVTRIAPLIAVMAMLLGSMTTASHAAIGDTPECPTSTAGGGEVLKSNILITVMVNSYQQQEILKNPDAHIVCVSAWASQSGWASISAGKTLEYSTGSVGTDTFVVGAVLNDRYYSSIVTISSYAVKMAKPKVVRKLKTGKVKKASVIKFSNPSDKLIRIDTYTTKTGGLKAYWVKPGRSIKVKTKLTRLEFMMGVELGSKKTSNPAHMTAGVIKTKTGKVKSSNLWLKH